MHLADGILGSPALVAAVDLAGAGAIAVALRRAFDATTRRIAWTGTLAAFVLAAQAINVPLVPGASAHAIGTALLVLCLGPARAIVALAAVLMVQALLLGDGGVTVYGLNVLDMAVVPALVTYGATRLFGTSPRGIALSGFFGAWLGTSLGAALLGSVLVLGAGAPAGTTFAWLVGVQALAGLAEGALTVVAVREIARRAPRLIGIVPARRDAPRALDDTTATRTASRHGVRWAAVALVIAAILVPFASNTPDALAVVLRHLQAP